MKHIPTFLKLSKSQEEIRNLQHPPAQQLGGFPKPAQPIQSRISKFHPAAKHNPTSQIRTKLGFNWQLNGFPDKNPSFSIPTKETQKQRNSKTSNNRVGIEMTTQKQIYHQIWIYGEVWKG